MNLNFKVPTWDFIMTDPSSPKISSPKNSSPKTSSPKLSHSAKHAQVDSVYNNQINLSGSVSPNISSPRNTTFINETGKISVKKSPSKISVVPNGTTSQPSPTSLKVSTQQHYYQVPNGSSSPSSASPNCSSPKCSSPILIPNQSFSISSPQLLHQSPQPQPQPHQQYQEISLPNTGYKLELEQRLHKRQLQKMLEKQVYEKEKLAENEKQNQLILQQQQIQSQQAQIQQQQQQIQQLQKIHQQQLNQQQQQHLNQQFQQINIHQHQQQFNNNNLPKNEIKTPISLPPLPNNKLKNNFPTCDLLLRSASPSSSPSFHNVPSVESHFITQDGQLQLPPIRDEIF